MDKDRLVRAYIGIVEGVREITEEEKALLEAHIDRIIAAEKEIKERASKLSLAIVDDINYIHECRPPVEIKRDIKHEKNPMRLKQLNRELNESYKCYKRINKK